MNFFIDERPGTDLPFVIVEESMGYKNDAMAFATRGEAEAFVEWANYSEAENVRVKR